MALITLKVVGGTVIYLVLLLVLALALERDKKTHNFINSPVGELTQKLWFTLTGVVVSFIPV